MKLTSVTPPKATDTIQDGRGTPAERAISCKLLNEKLRNHCIINNVDYLDFYEKCCDENGCLIVDFADEIDGYHLGKNHVVNEAFQKIYNEKWKNLE